ncbi:MAG: cyclic pyranopterin monophosphate synthase MoaC [Lachnospiraceae bacterium]|nr:cyclic pyranopterin monophosphate synthase MoaC [Lachnospiraceae bacterium]
MEFTHFDEAGNARMVDVSDKDVTRRKASAMAKVLVNKDTFGLIKEGGIKKGDVLTVAQIAGIMGSKKTSELIPMCHPVITDATEVRLKLNEDEHSIEIESCVSSTGRTGVEMEAVCACTVAAMTVYDMCKAVQRDIEITDIRLLSKSGGVHGDYVRNS